MAALFIGRAKVVGPMAALFIGGRSGRVEGCTVYREGRAEGCTVYREVGVAGPVVARFIGGQEWQGRWLHCTWKVLVWQCLWCCGGHFLDEEAEKVPIGAAEAESAAVKIRLESCIPILCNSGHIYRNLSSDCNVYIPRKALRGLIII